MTRKNALAGLAVAVALGLTLSACKDTKTLQENEQLKTQVAELQKENGQLGNDLETATAARDALGKENETLKAQLKARNAKHSGKKSPSKKRHASLSHDSFADHRSTWDAHMNLFLHLLKIGGNDYENV